MKKDNGYTNELIYSSSPYLLQHAHNPVDWRSWSEASLKKARAEHKLLLISIGYSACHWCHVMERESYADEEVAQYMNDHFIAIKVDREERPDVDQVYMDASILLNGSGGWPLNAFALPDGRPFHVLTYLPKAQWLALLKQIVKLYTTRPEIVTEQAEALTEGVKKERLIDKKRDVSKEEWVKKYRALWQAVRPYLDLKNGGMARAPKFPMPVVWEFLLQYSFLKKETASQEAVTSTLEGMAHGGIYDHLGGGFARYSVDGQWHVPHFEKMLYDNAQLVSLYAHAFQYSQNPLYKKVIEQTLDFIERELTRSEGGFYASLNADSEGEEGKFYIWKTAEIQSLLDPEAARLFLSYYQFTEEGNWEAGKNILHAVPSDETFAKEEGIGTEELHKILTAARQTLFTARTKRIPPSTDDKVLTSWNAMMITGYAAAYKALGTKDYLDTALHQAGFLADQLMREDGSLFRSFKENKAGITGLLEDYAFLAEAFIGLYEVTFDLRWLKKARKLSDYVNLHFKDEKSGLLYYTSDLSEVLIARKKEVEDQVIPASNSVMAQVFFKLGCYFDHKTYLDQATEMLSLVESKMASAAPYFSNWALLMGLLQSDFYEIAITGKKAGAYSKRMQSRYLPNAIFLGGMEENLPLLKGKIQKDGTFIYVCKDKTCLQPLGDPEEALKEVCG